MKPKQVCQFCEKKFKRVKGHYAFCKVRNNRLNQAEAPTNTMGLSPFHRPIKAANEYWEGMSDQQKLRACAFVSYTSDRAI